MLNENYEIWLEGIERPKYPPANLPAETEILVIGGGITGIICAYLLSKAGKKIILLEKKKLGEWVTDCTTGFLTGVIDTDPIKLKKIFGEDRARLIFQSHFEAIDEIEKIIKAEQIDCDFERCTNYIYANNKQEERDLQKLTDGYKNLGVSAEYKKENKLKFNNFGYIEMPNHAKFHIMKFVTTLAKSAVRYGAIIAEDTEVINLEDKDNFVNVLIKDGKNIKVKKVISATYTPFQDPKDLKGLCNMYREYVIEFKLPKNQFTLGTYEDTRSPYNYFRIDSQKDSDRLIIGGADHLNIIKMDREINYQTMRKYTQNLFSNTKLEEVRFWSGLMLETNDGLAYMGEIKNIFYIFGFSGNGITYAYIAGKILLDHVFNKENPYTNIYKIDRKIPWWKKLYLK